jgi:hypothetical protein
MLRSYIYDVSSVRLLVPTPLLWLMCRLFFHQHQPVPSCRECNNRMARGRERNREREGISAHSLRVERREGEGAYWESDATFSGRIGQGLTLESSESTSSFVLGSMSTEFSACDSDFVDTCTFIMNSYHHKSVSKYEGGRGRRMGRLVGRFEQVTYLLVGWTRNGGRFVLKQSKHERKQEMISFGQFRHL